MMEAAQAISDAVCRNMPPMRTTRPAMTEGMVRRSAVNVTSSAFCRISDSPRLTTIWLRSGSSRIGAISRR